MRKTTIAATALVALMASPVFAQSAAPGATPPAASSPPEASAPAPGASAATSSGTFVEAQRQDQWLASKLMGSKVRGGADETLGDISDVVIDGNGSVLAVVIGVGGFLGVGEKSVAVPFKSLEMVRATTGDKLVLRHSKDELKAAPSFQAYRPPSTGGAVTGSNTTAPATSTTR
ncbi:PRC-barrel domain-containing protein [Azorhizobium doebereinerae]|uniref:PRC-barrel domain-containing protein n=1 Tax=Azorhizobium doebereinerae TaxID=281091 RepID=UPI0004177B35|nr:PRC-barrel domain-containing protein [Azorhizobium doebereinerae]